MSLWSYESSLNDIQNCISNEIIQHLSTNKILGSILSINYEEYQILTSKLLCIQHSEEYEKYCLSIIVSWVSSCSFNREQYFFSKFMDSYKRLPQHHHSYVMEIFASTFYNYQFDTLGVSFNNVNDIHRVILYHGECYKYNHK